MDKRKLYIILIAAATVVLIGLVVLAICLSGNKPANGSETTKGKSETISQAEDDTKATDVTDTTADATSDTTEGTAETTEATQTTEEDSTKPDGSGNGNSNSENNPEGSNNNDPDNDPDDDPDDTPTNSGTQNNKPTTPKEEPLPNVYPYTLTYKEYLDMSEEEQIAFYKQFANHNEFKKWRTAAKKEYDENKLEIEIGDDGTIDLGKLTGGN